MLKITVYLVLVLSGLLGACAFSPSTAPERTDPATTRALLAYYDQWHGIRYAWGGSSTRGIDCSAFVQRVYADVFHTDLPRQTRRQAKTGKKVSRSSLRPGDLLFFKTGWRARHVGVYIGRGEFIHASRNSGVIKSSLYSNYWSDHFWKARRPHRT